MLKDHKKAIRVIKDNLNWLDKQIMLPYSEDQIAQNSYSKSALKDLYILLRKNPEIPTAILIEEYANKMDDYSCINEQSSIMFSVAHDISMAVLFDIEE